MIYAGAVRPFVARTAPHAPALCAALLSLLLVGCDARSGRDDEKSAAYLDQREAAKALLAEVEAAIEALSDLSASDLETFGERLDALGTRLDALPTSGDHPVAIDRARDRLEVARSVYDKLVSAHTSARGAADELAAARSAAATGDLARARRAFDRAEHHALTLKGTHMDVQVPLPDGPATADAVLRQIRLARAQTL